MVCKANVSLKTQLVVTLASGMNGMLIGRGCKQQQTFFAPPPKDDKETKKLDIPFAIAKAWIAYHCKIKSMDHLGGLVVHMVELPLN